jgi:CopG antitoxin of type II toxin-antitoxin system
MTRSRRELSEIKDLKEIPDFADEAEEAQFWATHQFSDSVAAGAVMPPHSLLPKPRPRTVPVAVRFDASTLERIKAVALRRHKGYQTLLKEFVVERLYEEERREGLIPVRREEET